MLDELFAGDVQRLGRSVDDAHTTGEIEAAEAAFAVADLAAAVTRTVCASRRPGIGDGLGYRVGLGLGDRAVFNQLVECLLHVVDPSRIRWCRRRACRRGACPPCRGSGRCASRRRCGRRGRVGLRADQRRGPERKASPETED